MSMISASQKRRSLRQQLLGSQAVRAPGIYDGYGARLVEQAGFTAVYMTGNGVSATLLGRPDVGLVDLTLMTDHARRVAASVNIPLICDADTGYGNVVNVRRSHWPSCFCCMRPLVWLPFIWRTRFHPNAARKCRATGQ